MRFLLYNIAYGAGAGRQLHFPLPYSGYFKKTNGNLKRIADFIKSVDPDITGLIEVDAGSYRSENQNQAEAIAREIEHAYVFRSKYGRRSLAHKLPLISKQGNAFLTNLEIKDKKFHYLNKGLKRLVMEVELSDLNVSLVHLSLKYRHRQNQLEDLSEIIQTSSKPIMVAGDFNAFKGDRELREFISATGLISANGNRRPSHPSRAPHRELDFILHSPEIKARKFQTAQVPYSDHIPLIYDFEVQSNRQ